MLTRWLIGLCLAVAVVPGLSGQAVSAASRSADLQVGAGFSYSWPDYAPGHFKGGAVYATVDFTNHLGGEFVVHQVDTPNSGDIYERSYEIGPRYVRHYGRLSPYVKVMYGRGVFNFPNDVANLAYNLFAAGGGADFRVLRYLNVRVDYEYQRWMSFPPQGLTPQLITIGVAYHFPGGLRRGQHY